MQLTENYMITPGEALCGLILSDGAYFSIGKIGPDQLADYATRSGQPIELIQKMIPNNL